MPVVLVRVPIVMQNSLHPLSTSSTVAHHLLDFMVKGKITEVDLQIIRKDTTPSRLLMPPHLSHPPLYAERLSATTMPIYAGLGQAPNNAGLDWYQSLIRNCF